MNASGSEPHDEKYFRSRMNQLRANLESDKGHLVALQEEMDEHLTDAPVNSSDNEGGQQMHWITDPVRSYNFWVSEDKRLRASIDSQKEKIAADEKDISDWVDQCRRENCKPGWIR